jgi:hypothetical protein
MKNFRQEQKWKFVLPCKDVLRPPPFGNNGLLGSILIGGEVIGSAFAPARFAGEKIQMVPASAVRTQRYANYLGLAETERLRNCPGANMTRSGAEKLRATRPRPR